jgi:hypothetical protein
MPIATLLAYSILVHAKGLPFHGVCRCHCSFGWTAVPSADGSESSPRLCQWRAIEEVLNSQEIAVLKAALTTASIDEEHEATREDMGLEIYNSWCAANPLLTAGYPTLSYIGHAHAYA